MAHALVRSHAHVDALRLESVAVVLGVGALVHLIRAEHTRPRIRARAGELVDQVRARRTVEARRRDAVVVVDLAVVAAVAACADAGVGKPVVEARARTQARCRSALVQLQVARAHGHVRVAGHARARVAVEPLGAGSAVEARRRLALVGVGLADIPNVPCNAQAAVHVGPQVTDRRVGGVRAGRSVHARVGLALVDVFVAVLAVAALNQAVIRDSLGETTLLELAGKTELVVATEHTARHENELLAVRPREVIGDFLRVVDAVDAGLLEPSIAHARVLKHAVDARASVGTRVR